MSTNQNSRPQLEKLLRERIVILDGAMGTTIRSYGLGEAEIRGERFKDSKKDLKNNGDFIRSRSPGPSATSIGAFSRLARTSSRRTRSRPRASARASFSWTIHAN